jgi:hypothetical protein
MLSQVQIDFFHQNGYLILRGLFQGEELRLLTEAVDAVQAQGVARQGENHLYLPGPNGEEVYWRSERIWSRGDIFRAVTVKPDLLEAIGQCVGQAFFPWNDSLVVKLAQSGAEVAWHQDPPYGTPYGDWSRTATYPIPNFTTDIYLDHSGPDNGCVWAIPGHHLVGHVDLSDKSAEDLYTKYGAKPIEMEAGDVLFHALSTPHGSRPNTSATQRRIFYIHYVAEEVFQEGYASTGADWVKQKPGWGEARRQLIEEFVEARRKFGWGDYREAGTLAFGEGGFLFTAEPTTPLRHWGVLADAMSAEHKSQLQQLQERVKA